MGSSQQMQVPKECKSIVVFGMKNGHFAQVFRKNERASTEEIILNSFNDELSNHLALEGFSVSTLMEDGVQVSKLTTETVVVMWSEVAWFQVTEVAQPSLIKTIPPSGMEVVKS